MLVAPMIAGNRELIAGVVRDPQFGPNVMLGVGGILAEAVADVVFRPVPISAVEAHEMVDVAGQPTPARCVPRRGRRRPRCARRRAARVVVAGRRAARHRQRRRQPADRRRRRPPGGRRRAGRGRTRPVHRRRHPADPVPSDAQFRALFEPRGVVVAGASGHPGKFGFASLHNILSNGFAGPGVRHQPPGRGGARHPDHRRSRRPSRRRADLVFVCTPARGQRAVAAGLRGQGRARRVRHQRRLRRGRRGRQARRGRARGGVRRARRAARRPERPGRGEHAGAPVRADRRARTRRPGASPWPARAATSSAAS